MLLVTGASGFLGGNVALEALGSGRSVVGAVHQHTADLPGLLVERVDLTEPSAARDLLERVEPQWVVNCAGFTNVDECERDSARARALNVELPRLLAAACADAGIGLAHISTDSVFDGKRGCYSESDDPAPLNNYARSKLEGERAVQEAHPDALVIRTNFIGNSPSRTVGLADWIASRLESHERIQGFADVVFAPLLATELARVLFAAIDAKLTGLYHAAASDACSKYDFARRLAMTLGFDPGLIDRSLLTDAKLAAPRPLNTSLSSSRLEAALARRMPPVDSAIAGYAALHTAAFANRT